MPVGIAAIEEKPLPIITVNWMTVIWYNFFTDALLINLVVRKARNSNISLPFADTYN